MKLKLRHPDFCDGCEQLLELNTLAQHKRCKLYKKNMLPRQDVYIANSGHGYLPRLEVCIKENEVEVRR